MSVSIKSLFLKLLGKDPDKDAASYSIPKNLTKREQKQIREIIEKVRGDDGVPRTAQQSIPFQRMFPDGICRVSDNYYSEERNHHTFDRYSYQGRFPTNVDAELLAKVLSNPEMAALLSALAKGMEQNS